jgi:hypothetical protein
MEESKKKELLARLKAEQGSLDEEAAHGNADDVLCEALTLLGHADLVEEWRKVPKWYA